ncbi:acyltransferase [Actinoplanes sp. L3-i22]|uniref:acyltransferase family protein n=1 Tax=Actinoplanes sp. L3-i22 TaxID=2836373 RepID=UPI001C78B3F0|nr:acyltransferase [Actinoplanes sp. L3-i22]BCY07180.1 hypothetical protein L3i22_022680 [Actinoplanes sp. L3-i22]
MAPGGKAASLGGNGGNGARAVAPGGQLPSLTGLRWVAAFLVFGFHLQIVGWFPDGVAARVQERLFAAGSTGVSFFFVLSGFVLMWSSARERTGEFWWRRFARVYPLHLVTALVVLAIGPVPGVRILVANLTLTQSWVPDIAYYQGVNAVSWTLSCEAFFYLLFPLLAAGVAGLRTDALVLVAVGAWLVTVAGPLVVPDGEWVFHWTPVGRLPEFACGLVLACLTRKITPNLARLWGAAAVLTVAGYRFAGHVPEPWNVAAYTLPGFSLVLLAAARSDLAGRWTPWRNRVTVRLGELSFAFYLVHLLVLQRFDLLVGDADLSTGRAAAVTLSALVLGVAAAWVLNVAVERPARRMLLARARVRSAG